MLYKSNYLDSLIAACGAIHKRGKLIITPTITLTIENPNVILLTFLAVRLGDFLVRFVGFVCFVIRVMLVSIIVQLLLGMCLNGHTFFVRHTVLLSPQI